MNRREQREFRKAKIDLRRAQRVEEGILRYIEAREAEEEARLTIRRLARLAGEA